MAHTHIPFRLSAVGSGCLGSAVRLILPSKLDSINSWFWFGHLYAIQIRNANTIVTGQRWWWRCTRRSTRRGWRRLFLESKSVALHIRNTLFKLFTFGFQVFCLIPVVCSAFAVQASGSNVNVECRVVRVSWWWCCIAAFPESGNSIWKRRWKPMTRAINGMHCVGILNYRRGNCAHLLKLWGDVESRGGETGTKR